MTSAFSLRISSPVAPTRTGACAGVLVDASKRERYLLTCSHVALGGSAENKGGTLAQKSPVFVQLFGVLKYHGNLGYAQLDETVDVAIIQLAPAPLDLINSLPNGQKIAAPIDPENLTIGQELGYFSSLRNRVEWGRILQVAAPQVTSLQYGNELRTFKNLLMVNSSGSGPSKAISVPGDSGSLLFTKNYEPVAVLIAAGNTCSYAIALSSILSRTNLQFI